jgi:hypothetical protein
MGRTRAIKTFMVTSAYRSMGLSRMSQTGAPGRLSFPIAALRVRLTHPINATPNITEVTPSYFEGTWNACLCLGAGRICE